MNRILLLIAVVFMAAQISAQVGINSSGVAPRAGTYFDINTGTYDMVFTTTGRLGIGTTSPQSNLSIFGNKSNLNFNVYAGFDILDIDFNGLLTDAKNVITNPGRLIRFDNRAGQPAISFWTRAAGVAYPTATEHMRLSILENGNVGIGTTSPTTKLDVNGGFRLRGSDATEGGQIDFDGGTSYPEATYIDRYQDQLRIFSTNATNSNVNLFNLGAGNMDLFVDGNVNTSGAVNLTGGVSGAAPTPLLTFNNYVDNSGNPSVSHLALYGTSYGFGITGSTLNYLSGNNHSFTNSSGARKMNLSTTTGKLTLDTYGTGTQTGTATYALAVDASGNLVEEALGGGETWYAITYGTNWGNGGGPNLECSCSSGGNVTFRGRAESTLAANPANVGTLPIQCRPTNSFYIRYDFYNYTSPANAIWPNISITSAGAIDPVGSLWDIGNGPNLFHIQFNKNN